MKWVRLRKQIKNKRSPTREFCTDFGKPENVPRLLATTIFHECENNTQPIFEEAFYFYVNGRQITRRQNGEIQSNYRIASRGGTRIFYALE